jgi:sensor histidine kinase YesM
MNPHFIFNSLSSIQNKIINEEPEIATDYLARFSLLFRNILEGSIEEYIPLVNELETIKNYLELQKVRFPDKFDYIIDIDTDIDIESVMVPPLLTQPFIENAIEHGIKHKEGKGHIDVKIERSSDWAIRQKADMVFEVEDDGVGREKAQEIMKKQDKGHKSLATKLTQERIAVLNRRSKKKISMEVIDLKDDQGDAMGTLVRFRLPIG